MTLSRSASRGGVLVRLVWAAMIACLVWPVPGAGQVKDRYPHKTLADAYRAAGFDPAGKDCFVFAATADTHYGIVDAAGIRPIIAELNAMAPRPRFFTIVGDMIADASKFFGQVPGEKQKARALGEYRKLKADLAGLHKEVPFQPVLGNHDTYPGEADSGLFRAGFGGIEPYGAFDVGGVHFLRLNGGPGGNIAGKQLAWLMADTAKVAPDRTVVVLVHQPALGSRVRERGISRAISRAFAKHTGPVWQISGHHHRNDVQVFRLPKTCVVQLTITRGTQPGWGSECPGYWVFCVRGGKLVGRIYRRLGQGYRVDPAPDPAKATTIPLPFEGRTDVLKAILVGQDDKPYRVKTDAADSVLDWMYIKELVYRLPLEGLAQAKKPTHFALLASVPLLRTRKDLKVSVSGDAKTWRELKTPGEKKDVFTFDIPPDLRAGKELYVRILSGGMASKLSVGGFAVCK